MWSVNRRFPAGIGALALAAILLAAGFRFDGLPFQPGAVFSDAATSHFPAALFLRESVLERGEWPVWRETFMAGAPFAANPLNKTAYPPQWLAAVFEPLALVNGLTLAHFALAGIGMWMWAQSLGITRQGALVSALAYMLAPRVLAHVGAGHLDLLYAAAWWPWLMWAAGQLGAQANWGRALLVSLFAGMLVLADVRLALYAWPGAAAAFAIAWQRAGRPVNTLLYGAVSAALTLGLAAAVIAPVIAWSPWITRSALTASEANAGLLTLGGFTAVFVPAASTGGQESLTYLGIVTLTLALVGAAALPRRWQVALGGLALLIALIALGSNGPVWPLLTRNDGLLAWFRVPARAWFVVVLLAAPLAGRGADVLLKADAHWRTRTSLTRWLRLTAFGILVVSAALGMVLLTVPDVRLGGMQMLLVGGGMGLALLLMLVGRLTDRRLWGVLLVLMIADAAFSARYWLDWRPVSALLAPYHAVAEVLRADDAARIYSPSYSLPQEAVAEAGLRLFGGVDPFQIAGVSAAILQAGGIEASGYQIVMPPLNETGDWRQSNRDAVIDAGLLAEWDVSHVVASFPIDHPNLALLTEIDGTSIYRNRLYRAQAESGVTPQFPPNWPGVPDQAEVAALNTITMNAWLGSMTLLAGVAGGLLLAALARRQPGGART
jgi:hypothetical protein